MYIVTDEEKQSYKSSGTIKRGYISIVPLSNEEEIILDDENNIKDFTILDEVYTSGYGILGSVISKQITLNLFKEPEIDLTNREIKAYIGTTVIENGQEVVKYVPYGTYIVQKPENEELTDKTSLEALDYMIKFNKTYKDTLTYPCTLKDVYNSICEQCGVISGTSEFPNQNFSVEDNQFVANETCREVLANIAQLAGAYARIDRDNKLYLKFFSSEKTEEITTDDYKRDIKINNVYGPINKLTLNMSQVEGESVSVEDTDSIDVIGVKELIISDNYFLYTQEKREKAINAIWNVVHNFKYVDFEANVEKARPYLDAGDSIKILSEDGTEHYTYLLSNEIIFDGGLNEKISATADTETETKYSMVPEISNKLKHTEIVVDKANQQIQLIASEIGDREEKTSTITQDIDRIESQIKDVIDFTRTQSGKDILHLNDCVAGTGYILELSIRDVNYLTPSDTLVPNDYLVPFGGYFTIIIDKQSRNNKTEDAIEYKIGLQDSLLRLDENVYDEVNIGSDGKVKVIRRVGRRANGNLYKLDKATEEEIGEVALATFDKDTYIYIKETVNANLYCKWIIKSDFSDVYATKVDLNSAITQTSTSIMTEVNRKVDETEFGTKIIQDFESVQIAWNQISQYIKMLGESGKASLAIFDKDNKKLTDFNSTGQHFYDNNKSIADVEILNMAKSETAEKQPGLFFTLDTSLIENGSMGWTYKSVNEDGTVVYYPYLWMGKRGDYQDVNLFLDVPLIAERQSIKFTNGGIYDNISGVGIEIYNKFEILDKNDNTIFQIKKNNDGTGTITTDLISRHNYGNNYYEGYNVIEMTKEHKVMTDYSSNTGTIAFYADEKFIDSIGLDISDKRLKYDFKNIDEKILKAIENIEIQQFKFIDTDNKIHFGIIAQDLIEIFNKYEINPEEYDILKSFKRKVSDDTTYYKIEYTQFLVLKQLATDYKIKKQQEEIEILKEKINSLERSVNNEQNNI